MKKFVFFSADFSLADWLDDMEIPSINDLKDNAKTLLLQQLDIDQYLLDTPCEASGDLYSPSVQGWNNRQFFYTNNMFFRSLLMKMRNVI